MIVSRLVATAGGPDGAADDAAEGVTPEAIPRIRQRSDATPGSP